MSSLCDNYDDIDCKQFLCVGVTCTGGIYKGAFNFSAQAPLLASY